MSFVVDTKTACSVAAGVLLALAAPPFDIWPLAVVGLWSLLVSLDDRSVVQRAARGWLCGATMFSITLWWIHQFSVVGWLLLVVLEGSFVGLAAALTPRKARWQLLAFPAALLFAELIRLNWPLGGLPMDSFTTGQASGPLAPATRVVGELGLIVLLASGAVCIRAAHAGVLPRALVLLRTRNSPTTRSDSHMVRDSVIIGLSALVVLIPTVVGARWNIESSASLFVATVQAGGELAIPRERQNAAKVFADHYKETAGVATPVDLILWPENVIRVSEPFETTRSHAVMADLAREYHTTVVAGLVEIDERSRKFRNLAVAWNGVDGTFDVYDKVHRVPFGEYVPARRQTERLTKIAEVPYDAIPGTAEPVLNVADHKAALAVSYEGLFSRHVRDGVRAGGELLLVPTNAASYKSRTVAHAQLRALELRAWESGRWGVQAAPTGISAIVDDRGRVLHRSEIKKPALLQDEVSLSSTETPYVRFGDTPMIAMSIGALLTAWIASTRRQRLDIRSARTQLAEQRRV